MAKQALFYVFSNTTTQENPLENKACDLAADAWRLGKKVLISCQNEEQAFLIDELLWQREPQQFVPHNLSGEVSGFMTPVEICWPGKRNSQRRDLLISLSLQVPEFALLFPQVIEFVPADEQLKVLARERYKYYRQLGWQLSTETV
ncbi:DNA polymerase III subunit chi [Gallibacterium anatis]|uniref:DNA polymerase III subunit chi n=1 Tax=Gallibacterium anatis TaxID=750 RepID=UPI000530F0EF|nr:DNA polymerase III subunit chi [Gallibacterium anatis]KGQ28460.1 DNA polymerase III subunit chi [Gallibacterium anatis]